MLRDEIVKRRHPEWSAYHVRWQWLNDSYVGGDHYRYAIYGYERTEGNRTLPLRNLVRHKREYPIGSNNTGDLPTDEGGTDYAVRLKRTPVPTRFQDAIERTVSRIFTQEIERESESLPDPVKVWSDNPTGNGVSFEEWIRTDVAPLFLTFGMLDFQFDRPSLPPGVVVTTEADAAAAGLTGLECHALPPMALVWWIPDKMPGRFLEALVKETRESKDSTEHECVYRYWDATQWKLYDKDGEQIDQGNHNFRMVPILRLFDKQMPGTRNVGVARFQAIAEIQREMYNTESELILGNTNQAHPILQGPEDYVKGNEAIPVGPGFVFPMKKMANGDGYQDWSVIDMPKGAADSLRADLERMEEACDQAEHRVRPAGSKGGTVAQSGISKAFDHEEANAFLAGVASSLESLESSLLAQAAVFQMPGITTDQLKSIRDSVRYPQDFQLLSGEELTASVKAFQEVLRDAGDAPETEAVLLERMLLNLAPGMATDQWDKLKKELEEVLGKKSSIKETTAEGAQDPPAIKFKSLPGIDANGNYPTQPIRSF